jgi:serine/threonine protein kinase
MMFTEGELAARAASRVGRVLSNKYRVEAVLGVGGMATVYSAAHRNGLRVAVKVLHTELSINAEIRRRFLREGHAASAVKHPGAVVVLDDDVADDGAAFLVMELLDGRSVEQLWDEQGPRLSERTVVAIAGELCDVLAAAHRAGVVHRDIKPANLFLTNDGRLKVLDFGIARVRDAAATATQTGSVFGTPAFMAPEQASGRNSLVDHQTDIWSVGATMFTLLTGRTVHEGETGQHLAMLSATRPARSVATVAPKLPGEIVAVVDRALSFEKTERWSSAESMHAALVEASKALFGESLPPLASLPEASPTLRDSRGPVIAGRPEPSPAERGLPVLGRTTGVPVSSEATTKRRAPVPTLTEVMSRVSALMRLGVAATVPVTAFDAEGAAGTKARRRRVIIGACLAIGVCATSAAVLHSRTRESSPATAASGPVPAETPTVASSLTSARSVIGASTTTIPPPVPRTMMSARTPTSSSSAKSPGAPQKRAAAVASAAGTSKASCTPPYAIDAAGKKLWKEECL